jgi:carnitine 3-dehydrogenase
MTAKPKEIRSVGLIGGGLIGSGWAARCLARGLDVTAWDPAPGAEQRMRDTIANAWPALTRVGLAPGADPARLRFLGTLEQAVADADFIQESVREDEDLKRRVLAQVTAAATPEAVVASSSSGLLPSRIQSDCKNPERVLIGHPFNPVYLIPLVEIVGGERTGATAVETAMAFYRSIGMRPMHARVEVPGYIADRLQEALWRESLHMVADGVASTDQIDDALRFAVGLRWSFMGINLVFHIGGGPGGMAHTLDQFGHALELPWTKLVAPPLTPELARRVIDGTAAQAKGRSIAELERFRDDCLISVMDALRACKARWGMDFED